jgi:hypothetical protein
MNEHQPVFANDPAMFAFQWKDGETIGNLTLLGATHSSKDLAMVLNRTKHRAKPLLPIDTDEPDDSFIASLCTKVTFFNPTDKEPKILQVNLFLNNVEREEQGMTSQKRICERKHIYHAKMLWNKLGRIGLHHNNSNESTYNDYIAWYNEETKLVLQRGSPKLFVQTYNLYIKPSSSYRFFDFARHSWFLLSFSKSIF